MSHGPDALSFYSSSYSSSANAAFGVGVGNAYDGPATADLDTYPTGWIAALTAAGYDGEKSLLEELGVNFNHIKVKTLTVLNPMGRIDNHIMDDTDLFGPLLFCVLFGFVLLISGKVHFGYVYGCALLGCITLHTILSLMSTTSTNFSRTASVLGYCLLPIVAASCIGAVISMDGMLGYTTTGLAVFWSTFSASAIFVAVLQMTDMRLLIAYPIALFYSIFALLTLFAERVDTRS
ncbi:hypothetical protein PYCC9005_002625 [Savitreella phatthalungensis]